MFFVCDKILSQRAIDLREEITKFGHPCAVGCISDIAEFLPLVQIVTFTDVFDDVRRTPYDNIPVLALGKTGFINSALNARRVNNEQILFKELDRVRKEYFHVQDDWIFWSGMFYDDGIFLSDKYHFITVFSNIVDFSERDYRIFKYIQSVARLGGYLPAERICQFSYPYSKIPKTTEEATKGISVHISYINRESIKILGYPLIENKRNHGYRLVKLY